MKFVGCKKEDGFILLRYKTTWGNSWQSCLDQMQVFFDDIKEELHLAKVYVIAGSAGEHIPTITEGLLYKTPQLMEEKGALSLAGVSKTLKTSIHMTFYNQLKVVDVQIPMGDNEITKEFETSDRVIDVYMDSIEINGRCAASKREGIHLYRDAMFASDMFSKGYDDMKEEEQAIMRKFKSTCTDVGATPFN